MAPQELMAIDVALLLPETVHTRARQINALLWRQRRDGFPFDASHAPHLTLVQQFIQKENWPLLAERVTSILRDGPPLPLRISSLVSHQSTVLFLVDPTPQLQSLHEALLHAAKPLEETGGTAAAFSADGEPAREARDEDVQWVAQYRTHASYANFVPHITLGIGTAPPSSTWAASAPAACCWRSGRWKHPLRYKHLRPLDIPES